MLLALREALRALSAAPRTTVLRMLQTITNSAAQQREHEYVNTTTRWDNNPLQAVDRLVTCDTWW